MGEFVRMRSDMVAVLVLASALVCGCGGGSNNSAGGNTTPPPAQNAATPTVSTAAAQGGAVVVSLADSTSGATIYYTLDGSTPTNTSMQYFAPFLVSSNLTVKAIAAASGYLNSSVLSKDFAPNIASGTLVWSDEFSNGGTTNLLPDAKTWTYDTGFRCCGNNELETYCAAGSSTAPCDPTNPNAYADATGILHIAGRHTSGTTYTSARLKTQGLFSFMYGRVEARMKLPESQGMWPAFWLLGNNIKTVSWPACGELDVMEHIDGNNPPLYAGGQPLGYDWIAGSVHGGSSSKEENGHSGGSYTASGFSAADWHVYGMIWSKGKVQYYVDDPSNVYVTYNSTDSEWSPVAWPFDQGPQFMILNLAIGGDWPGNPDASTVFPGDMQVDYVRIYTN